MTIFDMTTRPDAALFYQRDDSYDRRLGEITLQEIEDYPQAQIVLLGLPEDEGVQRNKGRIGAKDAPDAVRRCLYRLVEIPGLPLFDLGNTLLQKTLEDTHDTHQAIVEQLLKDDKRVIVLGGGNDTSYPDCASLAATAAGAVLAFNIDAHFDVRADEPCNSGTPYRQLLAAGHLQGMNFYEIGYQPFANSPTYMQYLIEQGVTAYDIHHTHEVGLAALLRTVLRSHTEQHIFWGLDMDVVRAADAPGVSAVNPSGLSGEEFCTIGHIAGLDSRSRIFEITEVNPAYDIDERTCRLAAATIWHFLRSLVYLPV